MGERVVSGTIVGVVGDIGMLPWQLDPPVDEQVYLARRIDWEATTAVLLRSRGDDQAALRALEGEVESLNRLAATFGPSSFNEDLAISTWEQRRLSQLFLLFGAASLVLVAGGLYSVVDLAGRRRARELGLRLALGAVPAQVRRLVLREGLVHLLGGAVIGAVALALLAPALRQFLLHVELWDPWLVAGSLALLALTVALAAAGPARRAGKLDPAETLRAE